ncbi:hypothetical protein GGTG_14339, partial [Gaeumannomyces tritici R3-111a-1]
VTRKLFGQYSIKKFGFLNSFAGAKLGFNKLFKKFRYLLGHFLKPFEKFNASFIINYVFAINTFGKPRTVIKAYWYTGVNGIILICLITKITVIKYRTFRIIILKKGQINKVLIIALLKINNFSRRERVTNIYIKQKKSSIRFGGKFIGIKSVAAAFVARFTLFFGESFFAAAVKTRRGVTGKTFAEVLKSCKRKKAR